MKKLYFSFALSALVFSVSAQDTLKPIQWITYPTATDWSTTPVAKNAVKIHKAPAAWTFDENTFDLSAFWTDASLGSENKCNKQVASLGGLSYVNGTLGGTWKAWYDSANLYVGIKYSDKNLLIKNGSHEVEIMYQTKYKDRFEPGFQASKSILTKNWQYARYGRIGGQKIWIKEGSYFGAGDNIGDGTWTETDAKIGTNPPTFIWTVDANNITWITLKLNFTDHLFYLDDISKPDTGTNDVVFDPAVKDTISWDIKIDAKDGSISDDNANNDQWCWNSTVNDVFEAVYYAGYLIFGDLGPNSIAKTYKTPPINVYLSKDMIKMQGIESGNLKVYSVLGQLVKSANNVNQLYVGDLTQGVYIVRLNDLCPSYKVVKR